MPLYSCASSANTKWRRCCWKHGADPNGKVYASGDPVFRLTISATGKWWNYCGVTAGYRKPPRRVFFVKRSRPKDAGRRSKVWERRRRRRYACRATVVGCAAAAMPRSYAWRWSTSIGPGMTRGGSAFMEQPIRMWSEGGAQLDCLKLILERCDPNIPGRSGDGFNLTILS